MLETEPRPPVAPRRPHVHTAHGEDRADDYAWLRNRDDPETIAYLTAENRYTEAMTAHTATLRARLYEEMLGHVQQTDLDVPTPQDGWLYYSRTEEGRQYPIHCRKRGEAGEEEVLLDLNALAEGQGLGYVKLSFAGLKPSPDHRRLAYALDTSGYEDFTVYVKELETGEIIESFGPVAAWGLEWAADGETLFYGVQDEAKRLHAVRRRSLGDPGSDTLVYREDDETFSVWLSKSASREYLFLNAGSKITDEVRFLESARPFEEPRVFAARRRGIEYTLEHHEGEFLVLTNEDAVNFRLMAAPLENPERESWRELIPHREEVKLDGLTVFRHHLVVSGREDGLTRLWVRDFGTGETRRVEFDEPLYTVYPADNREYDSSRFRLTYTSLLTPESVYDLDLDTLGLTLLKRTEVPGGYEPGRYRQERRWATAADGRRVPVSLVYREGALEAGPAPALLYGYGSYGASSNPSFSANRLALLDRGVVWAIAHVRGGGELGRPWYEGGKLLAKKNTFADFLACAEALIEDGVTASEKLAALGGSAGGLLMGAVVNMRPDLFRAVVAKVPFVDVISTMIDPSIPLTTLEYDEWGNPADPESYAYMRSYSPYDNVEAKAYPAMLVTTGLNDPRVAYWEPAKWTARLRATKTDANPLLLRTNMGAGHGGASGRYNYLREVAEDYAFVLDALGLGQEEEYLAARATRGSRAAFEQALGKVPPAQPEEPDRLE